MARILVLELLTAVAAALHTHALDAGYWIDEGISVGISSHHLVAIPGHGLLLKKRRTLS